MKKTLLILLCLILLCGCTAQSQQPSADAFLYYYPAESISPDDSGALLTVSASADFSSQPLEAVIRSYLEQSPPKDAKKVLPNEWVLTSVVQDNATAILVFSGMPAASQSQGLAFACLAKTLLQIPDIQRIRISYPGSSVPITLTSSDILLTDTGMLPQEETVTIYLPDNARRYLVRESFTVDAQQAKDQPRCIMEQLLSAGENGNPTSCIPTGTKLLSIDVENGICTVNLSSQFSSELERSFAAERMAVYSIVNSLTELPEINTVDFLIAGAPIDTLYLMDLSSGVVRDERILAPTSEKGIADVTIFPLSDCNGLLAAIPLTIETDNTSESVITALMEYEGINGMKRCIPAGTKLLSARMENNTCVVDLTAEFLAGCTNEEEETLAVRSIVATLSSLSGIQSVDILVEGLEPAFRNSALSGVHHADQSWFTE